MVLLLLSWTVLGDRLLISWTERGGSNSGPLTLPLGLASGSGLAIASYKTPAALEQSTHTQSYSRRTRRIIPYEDHEGI